MKVDYIIAGGQKCGTTALHHFLSKHPKIIVSNPKEIDFFNYDFNFNKGVDYYHSFFKHKPLFYSLRGFKFLEASPSYINGNLNAENLTTANRIYAYNPNVKIICMVRNPIHRAYSAWNMFKKRYESGDEDWWFQWFENRIGKRPDAIKRHKKSFSDFNYFVKEELDTLYKGELIECPILENGKYYSYIKEFKTVFQDNICVIANEELRSNTEIELKKICDFLGIRATDWSFASNKEIFAGNYRINIDDETIGILKKFYEQSNNNLFKLTGIRYE